jgi:hypothetical protein
MYSILKYVLHIYIYIYIYIYPVYIYIYIHIVMHKPLFLEFDAPLSPKCIAQNLQNLHIETVSNTVFRRYELMVHQTAAVKEGRNFLTAPRIFFGTCVHKHVYKIYVFLTKVYSSALAKFEFSSLKSSCARSWIIPNLLHNLGWQDCWWLMTWKKKFKASGSDLIKAI